MNPSAHHPGPSLFALALVYVGLFVASLVVGETMSQGAQLPTPFDSPQKIHEYFVAHTDMLRVFTFLQFASAIPLGLYAATASSRLRFLGVEAAGATIALFGGIAASIFLATSGLAGWVLSHPDVAQSLDSTRLLQLTSFATGGAGYVVAVGLLLAGVSVPSLFGKLLPRGVAIFGLVIAAVCELSTFSLVFDAAAYLLPVGRFGSFIWLIAAGRTLTSRRGE